MEWSGEWRSEMQKCNGGQEQGKRNRSKEYHMNGQKQGCDKKWEHRNRNKDNREVRKKWDKNRTKAG